MLKAIIFDVDDTLLDWEPREQDWFEYDRDHLRSVYDYVDREIHPLPGFEIFVELVQLRLDVFDLACGVGGRGERELAGFELRHRADLRSPCPESPHPCDRRVSRDT